MTRVLKGELSVYLFPTPPWCPDFLRSALSLGEISRSFIQCLKRLTHISLPGRVHQPHLCRDVSQWRTHGGCCNINRRWKCRRTVEMNPARACLEAFLTPVHPEMSNFWAVCVSQSLYGSANGGQGLWGGAGYPDGHMLPTYAESSVLINSGCLVRTKTVNAGSKISLQGPPGSNCALAVTVDTRSFSESRRLLLTRWYCHLKWHPDIEILLRP